MAFVARSQPSLNALWQASLAALCAMASKGIGISRSAYGSGVLARVCGECTMGGESWLSAFGSFALWPLIMTKLAHVNALALSGISSSTVSASASRRRDIARRAPASSRNDLTCAIMVAVCHRVRPRRPPGEVSGVMGIAAACMAAV